MLLIVGIREAFGLFAETALQKLIIVRCRAQCEETGWNKLSVQSAREDILARHAGTSDSPDCAELYFYVQLHSHDLRAVVIISCEIYRI